MGIASIEAFQLRQARLLSAIAQAESAFAVDGRARHLADEGLRTWLERAAITQRNARQSADSQLATIAALVNRGQSLAEKAIQTGPPPAVGDTPLPVTDSLQALSQADQDAHQALAGIETELEALSVWQARRSAVLRIIGICVLALLVLAGLYFGWGYLQEELATRAAAAEVAAEQASAAMTATTSVQETVTTAAVAAARLTRATSPVTSTPRPSRTPSNGGDAPPSTANAPDEMPTRATDSTVSTNPPQPAVPTSAICEGAFPTRLSVGDTARVINYQLNVRSGPSTNDTIVRRLDVGRTMEILDGPVCDDGQLWYYIRSELVTPRDGSQPYQAEGWLVEETGERYYLEPVP